MTELAAAEVSGALVGRLQAVCAILTGSEAPPSGEDPAHDASNLLDRLVRAVHPAPSPGQIWLLCAAVFGALPTPEVVIDGLRTFELNPVREVTLWLLDTALANDVAATATSDLRVVSDQVVIDVDHSARYDLHTGIQQVVRRTLPIWARDHEVLPVAWTGGSRSLRTLSDGEQRRALQWGLDPMRSADAPSSPTTVVPWRTVVVLPETPAREACDRLVALAQFSGNSLVVVGHDSIPITSADLVPAADTNRFVHYLTILKYARRVAGVSSSAASEFRGFSDALPAQGLAGPAVVACVLPTESPVPADTGPLAPPADEPSRPLVLCVGSFEPRKNHLGLLYASECLWRDGLDFQLLLIGGSGWGEEVPRSVAQLRRRGRKIEIRTGVADAELVAAYRRARFTVFASLHEGYGLPVAESISLGTPVITGNFGSTLEIGSAGGAVLIDPRDDEALVDAMRRLLTDDDLIRSLRQEIAVRSVRTWEQYAADLWDALVRPELPLGGRRYRAMGAAPLVTTKP